MLANENPGPAIVLQPLTQTSIGVLSQWYGIAQKSKATHQH